MLCSSLSDAAEASKILESTEVHENSGESDHDSFTDSSDRLIAPSSTENTNMVSQDDSTVRISDVVRQDQCSSDEPDKSQIVKKHGIKSEQSDVVTARKAIQRRRMSSVYLRDLLLHVPEMNLPWQSLRSVPQCLCGHTFSFTSRKVG